MIRERREKACERVCEHELGTLSWSILNYFKVLSSSMATSKYFIYFKGIMLVSIWFHTVFRTDKERDVVALTMLGTGDNRRTEWG